MATTLYLVVSGHGTTEQVGRYFYGHTDWQDGGCNLDEYQAVACILRVTADSAVECERHAEQQADRLRSGLFGVLTVTTLMEADEQVHKCYEDAVRRIVRRQEAEEAKQ